MMHTALFYHPIYLQHDTGPNHPERPSRLTAILRRLEKTKLIDKLILIEPEQASVEDIALVHTKDYIRSIEEFCKTAPHNLDPDTVISKDSFQAALFAAGAVEKAVDLILKGEITNAFCLVRPPGHHARLAQAMGFCIFNNVAIGAKYIQKKYGITRVLIIDWDVHHGNGTEEIFYEDDTVLYISLHQYPHYPGTGSSSDIGRGKGRGFNLNIPMEAGSGDNEYIKAFEEIIVPRARDFKPEFILISAGFDGHRDDPLSATNLTESGYRAMTDITCEIATSYANNRLVSVLEGGYNLVSLPMSVEQHLLAL